MHLRSRSATKAPLLMHDKAASFSVCSHWTRLCLCELWENASVSGLPTHRCGAIIWADSQWQCDFRFIPSEGLWAQHLNEIQASYWCSCGCGGYRFSRGGLCGCAHVKARLGSELIPIAPTVGPGAQLKQVWVPDFSESAVVDFWAPNLKDIWSYCQCSHSWDGGWRKCQQ